MKKFKIGLQLFSVRDEMKADMESTLKEVKKMGYDCVEFAGYFGKSADEVKKLLEETGLECNSVHQTHNVYLEDFKTNVDYIKTFGVKYSVIPWMQKEKVGTEEFINEVKTVGAKLKEEGITLLYHNHDFEFEKKDGMYILDWVYSSVDSSILQTEIDTCWAKFAGCDPVEYILKYTGRAPIVHLKDFTANNFKGGPVYGLIDSKGEGGSSDSKNDTGFEFQPVGYGVQDIPSIIAAAEKAGTHTLIVEQDQSPTRPPLESAKMSIDYLRSLGL